MFNRDQERRIINNYYLGGAWEHDANTRVLPDWGFDTSAPGITTLSRRLYWITASSGSTEWFPLRVAIIHIHFKNGSR
jgi:hypothetical protein